MNKYAKTLIIALALTAVIAGASIAYNAAIKRAENSAENSTETLTEEMTLIPETSSTTAKAKKETTSSSVVTEQTTTSKATTRAEMQNDAESEARRAAPSQRSENNAKWGDAPDFTVTDAGGNSVSLSSHLGRPVIVNFWASWCGPCKNELPAFDSIYKKYGGEVDIMMVNLADGYRETVSAAKSFIASNGYSFPVYFDVDSSAQTAYSVRSIPRTVFIYSDGNVMSQHTGMITESELETNIKKLIG